PAPDRPRPKRRRLTIGPPSPERLDDRLSGTLVLDWVNAALLLTLLPLIVTANLAVGKPWAGVATAALCGSTAGAFCLYGAVDITGLAPLVSRDLSLRRGSGSTPASSS